jgi:hypothetical protein
VPDIKISKYNSLADAVTSVTNSHLAVIEGIANHAEKHRLEMHAKRDALEQKSMLSRKLPNAST